MGVTHLSRISAIASDQWGMVTAAQAVASGTGAQALARLANNGELERIGHGIYRLAGAPPGPHDELRAAWLAIDPGRTAAERIGTGPTEVVSHRSAAVLHELGDLEADVLEFTTSVRRQTRRRDVTFHRGIIGLDEWTLVDGLPATTPLRTITDLAVAHVDQGHLGGAVRDAILVHAVPVGDAAAALAPYARAYGATAGDGRHLVSLLLREVGIPQSALNMAAYLSSPGGSAQGDRQVTENAVDDTVRAIISTALADLVASPDLTSGTKTALHRWLKDRTPVHPAGDQTRCGVAFFAPSGMEREAPTDGEQAMATEAVIPAPEERAALVRFADLLNTGGDRALTLVRGGADVELPGSVGAVLARIAEVLASGRGVAVVPMDQELTTREAAELLGVSRPTLIKLLEAGEIGYSQPNSSRRIPLDQVLAYKQRRSHQQRRAEQYAALDATFVSLDDEEDLDSALQQLREARRAVASRRHYTASSTRGEIPITALAAELGEGQYK